MPITAKIAKPPSTLTITLSWGERFSGWRMVGANLKIAEPTATNTYMALNR